MVAFVNDLSDEEEPFVNAGESRDAADVSWGRIVAVDDGVPVVFVRSSPAAMKSPIFFGLDSASLMFEVAVVAVSVEFKVADALDTSVKTVTAPKSRMRISLIRNKKRQASCPAKKKCWPALCWLGSLDAALYRTLALASIFQPQTSCSTALSWKALLEWSDF